MRIHLSSVANIIELLVAVIAMTRYLNPKFNLVLHKHYNYCEHTFNKSNNLKCPSSVTKAHIDLLGIKHDCTILNDSLYYAINTCFRRQYNYRVDFVATNTTSYVIAKNYPFISVLSTKTVLSQYYTVYDNNRFIYS